VGEVPNIAQADPGGCCQPWADPSAARARARRSGAVLRSGLRAAPKGAGGPRRAAPGRSGR
jgi:hypothetical protein